MYVFNIKTRGYDTGAVGAGGALQQYGKDMGAAFIGQGLSDELDSRNQLENNLDNAKHNLSNAKSDLDKSIDAENNLDMATNNQEEAQKILKEWIEKLFSREREEERKNA